MDVINLIQTCKAFGVKDFEGYGVKLSFHDSKEIKTDKPEKSKVHLTPGDQEIVKKLQDAAINSQGINQEKSEVLADPGLASTMDEELNYSKILNWSAPPDTTETSTPGTGDVALT